MKFLKQLTALLLALALCLTLAASTLGAPGSEDDPAVSVSYLEKVWAKKLLEDAQAQILACEPIVARPGEAAPRALDADFDVAWPSLGVVIPERAAEGHIRSVGHDEQGILADTHCPRQRHRAVIDVDGAGIRPPVRPSQFERGAVDEAPGSF